MCLKAGCLALRLVGQVFLNGREFADVLDSGGDVLFYHDALSDYQADGISVESLASVVRIHFVRRDGWLELEVIDQNIRKDVVIGGEVLHDCERSGSQAALAVARAELM